MRVLWFSNTPGSGAEKLGMNVTGGGWIKSLDRLIGEKTELSVAFSFPKPAKSFNHEKIFYIPIVPNNWRLAWLKSRIFPNIVNTENIGIYEKIINEIKPDLIHIHGTENQFESIVGIQRIPVIVSLQGIITVCHHKFFSGIERRYLYRGQWTFNRIYDFPFYQSYRQDFLKFSQLKEHEIETLRRCRNIIGRTAWDKRITSLLAPNSRYFHCDEILRDGFYTHQWIYHRKDEKIIIHTTTGNSPSKGFETVCQALNLLNNFHFNIEWRVAGINESDLIVKAVKRKLGKEYPTKGLVLLGNLDEGDLIGKLLEADIYVMPSHIENSPNNLCEAMILGMPCIATFVGGTVSLLKDGEEGILIQDGDPYAMAGAIIELSENPEFAIKIGANSRKRALIRHDKEKIVNDLLKIYQEIINSGQ